VASGGMTSGMTSERRTGAQIEPLDEATFRSGSEGRASLTALQEPVHSRCPALQPAHDVGPYVLGGKAHRCVAGVGSQLPEVAGEVVVLETLREPMELSKWLDAGRVASRSVFKRLTGGPQLNLVLVEGRSPIEVPVSATLHKVKFASPTSGCVVSTPRLGRTRKRAQPATGDGIALGIAFTVDPVGAGLATLAGVLATAALTFSWRIFEAVRTLHHCLMLVFLAAIVGFCLSGDLFNMFVSTSCSASPPTPWPATGQRIRDRCAERSTSPSPTRSERSWC
jgi:hypothetical protein